MNFDLETRFLKNGSIDFVIGVDEAGRGPLAGPVVAGAFCFYEKCQIYKQDSLNEDDSFVKDWPWSKVGDSKALSEEDREILYDSFLDLIQGETADEKVNAENISPNDTIILFASSSAEPDEIDRINILEATMRSMTRAVYKVLKIVLRLTKKNSVRFKVLVDGNRKPQLMETYLKSLIVPSVLAESHTVSVVEWRDLFVPWCGAISCDTIVKGDAKVLSIAASSIVAKVVRDRLMRELDKQYPDYKLGINKGYPTPEHQQIVRSIGPSRIHRLTFAPIYELLKKGTFEVPSGRDFEELIIIKSLKKRQTTIKQEPKARNVKRRKLSS